MRIDLHPEILGTPQPRPDPSPPGPVAAPEGPPSPEGQVLHWTTEVDCERAAARLAHLGMASARTGTLTLEGPLGAGKSAFSRHLLQHLGVRGRIKSPTYTLVEPYTTAHPADGHPMAIAHCDFYRFRDPSEWEDSGLRELFAAAALRLVEWPRRAEGRLGPVSLELHLVPVAGDPTARTVHARAHDATGRAWLAALADPPRRPDPQAPGPAAAGSTP